MQPIVIAVAGLYVTIGFVVLFRRLRQRTLPFDVSAPQNGDPLGWLAVAALWPLYFRDPRPKDGVNSDRRG